MDRFKPREDSVMVIDDDIDTRERLRKLLEADGWRVTERRTGWRASIALPPLGRAWCCSI